MDKEWLLVDMKGTFDIQNASEYTGILRLWPVYAAIDEFMPAFRDLCRLREEKGWPPIEWRTWNDARVDRFDFPEQDHWSKHVWTIHGMVQHFGKRE